MHESHIRNLQAEFFAQGDKEAFHKLPVLLELHDPTPSCLTRVQSALEKNYEKWCEYVIARKKDAECRKNSEPSRVGPGRAGPSRAGTSE
jgi:hypothetical protein